VSSAKWDKTESVGLGRFGTQCVPSCPKATWYHRILAGKLTHIGRQVWLSLGVTSANWDKTVSVGSGRFGAPCVPSCPKATRPPKNKS
jgi:hypothetical protein